MQNEDMNPIFFFGFRRHRGCYSLYMRSQTRATDVTALINTKTGRLRRIVIEGAGEGNEFERKSFRSFAAAIENYSGWPWADSDLAWRAKVDPVMHARSYMWRHEAREILKSLKLCLLASRTPQIRRSMRTEKIVPMELEFTYKPRR